MIKELLPTSIAVDEGIQKLAESTEGVFSFLFSEVGKTLIYSRIDELPEEVLDLLAWQFHIEGYELASTIEEKKRLIKKAIELHRYKGTKWAVEKALEALGVDSVLEEWFEYGGEPYHFKVLLSGIKEEAKWKEIRKAIDEYKNVRSWYDIVAHNKTFGDLKIGYLTTHGYRYELFLDVRLSSLQGIHTLGAKPYSAYSYSILPYSPSLNIENSTFSAGSVMHMAIKMEVATHG
ncbi:MAG: phage tail protein I [Desulfurococcaceae archaeon]